MDGADAENGLGSARAHEYPLYAGKPLLDLESGFPFGDGVTLSIGARNVLNTHPEDHPRASGDGNRYGTFSPFGFNGGYYYARINYGWGG